MRNHQIYRKTIKGADGRIFPFKGVFDSFYYISKVGNFEARILWRSWLFRIFSILILAILFLFDLFGVLGLAGSEPWAGRYIPGNIVYMNFFIFTVAQVVIAAFLSADFLGRERKMDTTEVFYTRPMSNLQYVLGKTWGALVVFLGLNLVVACLALVVTLLSPDAVFAIKPFLFYLFSYSLPSLVFILGFSFVLMVLLRNQAVTFVLVLGFGGIVLFYLQNMHWGIWDFMGFYLPVNYSGFTGFSEFHEILMQRMAFFLLGLFGILLTAFFLPRLPGHKNRSKFLTLSVLLAFLGAGSLFYSIISHGIEGQNLREKIRQSEALLPDLPGSSIDSCYLDVLHEGTQIKCDAFLKVRIIKKTDTLRLALNPGFKIGKVLIDDEETGFDFKFGILSVDISDINMASDSLLHCHLEYKGSPDNDAVYPYIDEKNRERLSRFDPLVAGKEYAFVQSNFILLTREAGWYPQSAWKNYRQQPEFSGYTLDFSSENNLQVFSQGKCRMKNTKIEFLNDQPLNALTLIAGEYASDTVTVDSVDYQLSVQKQNMLIRNNFDQVGDTLPALIRDLKNQYERKLGLKYPFKRLKVIEVPIHFFSYLQPWRSGTDHIQPEMILLPEYGGGQWFLDVSRTRTDFEKEAEEQGKEPDGKDIQARMFITLAGNSFLFPRWGIFGSGQETNRNMEEWNRIQVFPLFFYYAYQIHEKGWPVFQIMMEDALRNKGKKEENDWRSSRDQYKGLLALREASLSEWLQRENASDTVARILNLRGVQFFSEISALLGKGDFVDAFQQPLNKFRFQPHSPKQWLSNVSDVSDPGKKYLIFVEGKELPAYEFGDVETSAFQKEGKKQYSVSLEVTNKGQVGGALKTQTSFLDLSENRNMSFSQWMYQNIEKEQNQAKQLYFIEGKESVRINMVYDQLPRELKIYTGVAQNIPPVYTFPLGNFEEKEMMNSGNEVQKTDPVVDKQEDEDVLIVDNEDAGFSIASRGEVKTLKDWWLKHKSKQVKTYESFNYWNPQPVWTTSLGENYYGDFLRSAVLKAVGKGDDKARWTCNLPKSGSYEVQVFIPANLQTGWRNRNSRGGFHYQIYHANGMDEVVSPPVRELNGWISLGRFFFDKGNAIVELSDRSEFSYVVADAVKWIKLN